MTNIPVVKLGIIAVSRDCFPIELSIRRRQAIVAAYPGELYECSVTVENELDMQKAVKEVKDAGCNALVVFLGNFGPETPETLIAKHFDEMRLFETAKQAAEGGFDSFTSSLFISPYQNHELMAQIAQQAADTYGVEFLYRDFRPYFKDGQAFAREKGFYMQKYCGCVFSEEERYLKAKKIIP